MVTLHLLSKRLSGQREKEHKIMSRVVFKYLKKFTFRKLYIHTVSSYNKILIDNTK